MDSISAFDKSSSLNRGSGLSNKVASVKSYNSNNNSMQRKSLRIEGADDGWAELAGTEQKYTSYLNWAELEHIRF